MSVWSSKLVAFWAYRTTIRVIWKDQFTIMIVQLEVFETDQSVIKRVSNNLIQAKRKRPKYEFYLNPNLLAEYIAKK